MATEDDLGATRHQGGPNSFQRADPQPDRASQELDDWLNLAPNFAAISPNLIELQTVLSLPRSEETQDDVVHAAEIFHRKLKEAHADAAPALVLRAGALGSYTIATGWKGWVPAYWRRTEQDRVVDVTGGGNAFLGGLCAGLLASDGNYRTGWCGCRISLIAANIYASAAASFAIEQRGLPRLESTSNGETWNGCEAWSRIQEMARRVDDMEAA